MARAGAALAIPTAQNRHILAVVSTGTAALSLAGSAFIVLCYLLFKELRKFSFKLVFFLALSIYQHLTIVIPYGKHSLQKAFCLRSAGVHRYMPERIRRLFSVWFKLRG